jgi:Icc-related predicted phosphoesterase
MRILAIADEVSDALGPESMRSLRPDLVVSCGDLPFEYLEYVVTVANRPLLMVPGNHDPALVRHPAPVSAGMGPLDPRTDDQVGQPGRPEGCISVDGRVVAVSGLLVAGLGGSIRYRDGPNQYSQRQMRRRAGLLALRARLRHPRRGVDVLVTHAPPLGLGDEEDPPHRGVAALVALTSRLRPRLLVHGHIHPHGEPRPDRWLGATRVVNAVPFRLIELPTAVEGGRA